MTPERRYMVMKWAAVDPDDGWSPDLAAWADAWVAVQLDEEERPAYEQAYAEYQEREQARYYAAQQEADRQLWYSIQEPPWA